MTSAAIASALDAGQVDHGPRILIVDDNEAIHDDFRKVLNTAVQGPSDLEAQLFGQDADPADQPLAYRIDSAFQGLAAIEDVISARGAGEPYSVIFMDVRMPPGLDGIKTTAKILELDRQVQVVICTAFSDYSWEELTHEIGQSDRFLILKKPFDPVEVRQLAAALHRKWELAHEAASALAGLETEVRARTKDLESANAQLRREIEENERLESDLRLAQKLEAVGQLAAGIAHEINTPMQYIGDNLKFLSNAFDNITTLVSEYQEASQYLQPEQAERIAKAESEADIHFLMRDIPGAIQETTSGADSVSHIVKAMKSFSHHSPGGTKGDADINQGIRDTLTVARNEYKHCAEIELDLGELPLVHCAIGDLNQVFLNLIVNAAHAIGDSVSGNGDKGTIGVRTRALEDGSVSIAVSDTGRGIPPEIQGRVFDPFFTTKEVGRGSGQGLAISRTIVVERHGGTLSFCSEPRAGTTFEMVLPATPAD